MFTSVAHRLRDYIMEDYCRSGSTCKSLMIIIMHILQTMLETLHVVVHTQHGVYGSEPIENAHFPILLYTVHV